MTSTTRLSISDVTECRSPSSHSFRRPAAEQRSFWILTETNLEFTNERPNCSRRAGAPGRCASPGSLDCHIAPHDTQTWHPRRHGHRGQRLGHSLAVGSGDGTFSEGFRSHHPSDLGFGHHPCPHFWSCTFLGGCTKSSARGNTGLHQNAHFMHSMSHCDPERRHSLPEVWVDIRSPLKPKSNKCVERMRGSRFAPLQYERQRRRPPVAHAGRWRHK
jgi:hypothetical protein